MEPRSSKDETEQTMTPKPLVDILDEILFEVIKEAVLHGRENAGKDIDYPVSAKTFLTKEAIIKAIKERVPKRKPVLDDNDEEFKGLYQNEIREYKAVTLGHNSAIDQLNRNLWGRDE